MLTIGDVAARAGLRPSAIRYYEEQGLVPEVHRKGAKRIYDASILDRLALIELAKAAGFRLEEIRSLLADTGQRRPASIWRKLAGAKRADLDEQILRVAAMKDVLSMLTRCTCTTLADCGRALNAARSQHQAHHLRALPSKLPLESAAQRRSSRKRFKRRGSAAKR